MADVERPGTQHRPVRIGAERGTVPHAGVGDVVITAPPSAVLRLRGRDGWDEAFDSLVRDLEVAKSIAGGR